MDAFDFVGLQISFERVVDIRFSPGLSEGMIFVFIAIKQIRKKLATDKQSVKLVVKSLETNNCKFGGANFEPQEFLIH